MSVISEIIIMLLILGLLVSIHEAGHLATAKLFKVYCFEYSIGMGPALIHRKKKGGETYFSLRAIPFGGYVSMYGEAENVKLEEGESLPPENRSIEAIKKWKKLIVLFAGVFLNFLLGLLLIFISVSCFPQYVYGNGYAYGVQQDTIAFVSIEQDVQSTTYQSIISAKAEDIGIEEYDLFLGFQEYKVGEETISSPRIVSTDVVISSSSTDPFEAVAVYYPSSLTESHSLLNDLYFYEPLKNSSNEVITLGEPYSNLGITKLPNINETSTNYIQLNNGTPYSISMTLRFAPVESDKLSETRTLTSSVIEVAYNNISIVSDTRAGMDVKLLPISFYNTFSQAVDDWKYYVPYCCTAIVKGLASMFTLEGLSQMSGVVGMTAAVGTYSAMGGASMLFLFAGLISINLAFFNLLPIPGLDGYQMVITCIEGISKKKIPAKIKTAITLVGLFLIFGLMIGITIKDIVNLF